MLILTCAYLLRDYELTDEEEKLLADRINGRYTSKQDDPHASVGGTFAEGLWEGVKDVTISEIPGIAQGRAGYEIQTRHI